MGFYCILENVIPISLSQKKLEASKSLLEKLAKRHIINIKYIFRTQTKTTPGISEQQEML